MNQDQVKQLNEAIEAVRGHEIENVYFVACGGSKAIFDPAQYIFDLETTIPAFVYNANEFIHRCPKGLGKKSLAFALSFRASDRTLTDEEIAASMEKIQAACAKLGAQLRK